MKPILVAWARPGLLRIHGRLRTIPWCGRWRGVAWLCWNRMDRPGRRLTRCCCRYAP